MRYQEMQNEANLEFRKIPSLFFFYEISEDGSIVRNVKSKRHTKITIDRRKEKAPYAFACFNIKGKVYRCPIARLVAECWLGPRPEGLEIDHINRDSLDNRYTNLRYVTHSEQMKNRVLSDKVLNKCKENCQRHNQLISKPVVIDGIVYPSISSAATFLAIKHGKDYEHMRNKLKKRRANIYGHEIEYRNAETRHGNQEIGKE